MTDEEKAHLQSYREKLIGTGVLDHLIDVAEASYDHFGETFGESGFAGVEAQVWGLASAAAERLEKEAHARIERETEGFGEW